MGHRWRYPSASGRLVLGALLVAGATSVGGRDDAWASSACAGGRPALAATARTRPVVLADLATAAWFRLEPSLDAGGALDGQRLTVGLERDAVGRAVDLPPESFAAGPFGRTVLVGRDDGSSSRLLALDASSGCVTDLATEPAVIRRATMSADGSDVFEMRVDRRTRADLGIWRRPVAGGEASQVLPPVERDARFGATWSTELGWSAEGDRLIVESCGGDACRVRAVDPASGAVRTVAEPDLGTVVGVAAGRLLSFGACRGVPCPLISTDLATGRRRVLEPAAVGATLASDGRRPRLVVEGRDTNGTRRIRWMDPDAAEAVDLGALPDGLGLAPAGLDGSGHGLLIGWLRLTAEAGGATAPDQAPLLRSITNGRTVTVEEVTR